MAPEADVNAIDNLLISATDRGSQDHESLLECYKFFNQYLIQTQVVKPVVLLSDGHSSRFDYTVLKFLMENNIRLFISPPDTTGVTQLLDQVNKTLHLRYKTAKEDLFTTMMTLNREAFMIILGTMWNTWAAPASIINAAKRVGITSSGLSVEYMQKEKFQQAENCMEVEPQLSSTPNQPIIESPAHRKSSAQYWKAKFEKAIDLVHELNEQTLNLEQGPGLMTIKKVKPKMSKVSNKVTNIHGSMTGKGVLDLSKEIEEKKNRIKEASKARQEQKEGQKQAFLRCKDECLCKGRKCEANNLKQCPTCHDILLSVCSKMSCKTSAGSKPTMILPAACKSQKKPLPRRELFSDDEETDIDTSSIDGVDDEDSDANEKVDSEDNEDEDNPVAVATRELQAVWKQLSPPAKEEDIIGKWYAVIYKSRRVPMLYIGKVKARFLHDKDGPVESILIRCLKPKIGSGIVLEDTPAHQPADEWHFPLADIIAGPITVTPKGSRCFEVPMYERIQKQFRLTTKLQRTLITLKQ